MFISIFGMFIAYKRYPSIATLFLGIILANLLLYSMWGDPHGGWAFGGRYMIPGYAIMAIFIAIALQKLQKNYLFLLCVLVLMVYSVFVNTAGAITSNANPPKHEVLGLEKMSGIEEKYTYERNLDMLKENKSKSFVWRTYLSKDITAMNYYLVLGGLISITLILILVGGAAKGRYEKN